MNRKERRAAGKRARSNTDRTDTDRESSYLFASARKHYDQGRFAQAELICRKVLAGNPDHANTLHLLGIIANKNGKPAESLGLIGKAIALSPGAATFQYNMGLALQALGRLEEATGHYERATILQPNWAGAHLALGQALFHQGDLIQAGIAYERSIRIEPGSVEALYMFGNLLQLQGRIDEAVARYQQALAIRPYFAEVHNNLGNAFRQQGKLDKAIASCRRSLELNSGNAEARNNLGLALQQQGLIEAAIEQYQIALSLRPNLEEARRSLCLALMANGSYDEALSHAMLALDIRESVSTKAIFVQCIRGISTIRSFHQSEKLLRLIIRALSESWGRAVDLACVSALLIKSNCAINECITRLKTGDYLLELSQLISIGENELLRCLLISTPVCDPELEQLLVRVRVSMLELAIANTHSGFFESTTLGFFCALARQCFVNEYVFSCADGENDKARRLREWVISSFQSEGIVPELWLITVAAYFPLHSLSVADLILQRSWSDSVNGLVIQQVLEPRQERQCRARISSLTRVTDDTSKLVQQQYEESPYPRWVNTAPMGSPTTIGRFLRGLLPTGSFSCVDESGGIDVLVAGCGTGQQSIEIAQRFLGARVLAIDLSMTSLCYAERKTLELRLDNIQYAQADILQLGNIGRTFDLIEATGVLHHLADPTAGWQILVSLLRPGGYMRIGVYSRLARQDIIAARAFVSQRGYTFSDIRRCREELKASDCSPRLKNVTKNADFYCTSGCRDLLFNVQEHRMTLPEINHFLTKNSLKFLGFNIESQVITQFRRSFPEKALTDLNVWHLFETKNPATFIRMYQFWVQKVP